MQTSIQKAGFGIAYWRRKAKQLKEENFALREERDLWKDKALRLKKTVISKM